MVALIDRLIVAVLSDPNTRDDMSIRPAIKVIWKEPKEPSRLRVWLGALLDELPDPRKSS